MGHFTDLVDDGAKQYLKPEHQKWLHFNYHHPDTEGLAKSAVQAAMSHPEVEAARAREEDAMSAFSADRGNASLKSKWLKTSDASMDTFNKKIAEHFGANVDAYIGLAGERERQAQESRKQAEISSVDSKFRALPNGNYSRLCEKCGGQGFIPQFRHNGGECYSCGGSGMSSDKKQYTKEDIAGIKASIAARYDNPTAKPVSSPTPAPSSTPSQKPKGFTNKYAGNCVGCGTRVGVGEGITSKGNAGWEVRCVGCHHG